MTPDDWAPSPRVADALAHWGDHCDTQLLAPHPAPPAPRPTRPRRLLVVSAACAAVIVVAGTVVLVDRWGRASRDVSVGTYGAHSAPAPSSGVQSVTGQGPVSIQEHASLKAYPTAGSNGCEMAAFGLPGGNGRPSAVAPGDGGSIWFVDPGASSVGRIDATGTVTRYPLPAGSGPQGVARGSNGDIWFTEAGTTAGGPDDVPDAPVPAIGRVTAAGAVEHFPLPTRGANPLGPPGTGSLPTAVTAGRDGAMWFTETGADAIGRITSNGAITEFLLPSRGQVHAAPGAIVSGPDGALWFTQPLRESLGRIDPDTHAFSEFFLPPPRGGIVRAASLASGPGNALWYEDGRNQALGRVTPDGKVDAVPLPAGGGYRPWAVTAGTDGRLWVVDLLGSRVVSVTPGGAVTPFPSVDGLTMGAPQQMAVATDGAVWFAIAGANGIGRIAC